MTRPGFTVWLTGPPCSGKTTLGRLLMEELTARGVGAAHLDGEEVRARLAPDLGFGPKDRHWANLRAAWVARQLNQAGAACVVSAIAPFADTRRDVRSSLGRYVEVFLDCSLEQLINRDRRGLYERALAGGGADFTGLGSPYETPDDPEVHCLTGQEPPAQSLGKILAYLEQARLIPPAGETAAQEPAPRGQGEGAYSPEEEAELTERLKELGYL